MEKESPGASGVMVGPACRRIVGDVSADQPEAALLGAHVSLPNADMPEPNGLDLGAQQRETSFERLEDVIVVRSLAIKGNCLLAHGNELSMKRKTPRRLCGALESSTT
jgi:hypothetical protein